MAELLTHVLVAYACFTVASWRLEWLTSRWIAVGLVGALLPDLNRLGLVIPEPAIEAAIGLPFDFGALHTLGGALVLAALGACFFRTGQHRAFGLLFAGALTHLLLDALKVYADGAASMWLYPFSWYRHPSPNLYVSADPLVLIIAILGSVGIWYVDRTIDRENR